MKTKPPLNPQMPHINEDNYREESIEVTGLARNVYLHASQLVWGIRIIPEPGKATKAVLGMALRWAPVLNAVKAVATFDTQVEGGLAFSDSESQQFSRFEKMMRQMEGTANQLMGGHKKAAHHV
jgi:hypothetical protein